MSELELLEVQYAARPELPLLMTIVRQVGGTNLPVLLNIHGGGWVAGCRSAEMPTITPECARELLNWPADYVRKAMAHDSALEGYLYIDVDYSLAPFRPYPAACEDLHTAVRWMVEHAAEYGGDPSRIGTFGLSAGGHLAAWLAMTSPMPITCAISWSGDMDLHDPALLDKVQYPHGHANCLLAFLGVCVHDDPELYTALSPISYFSPQSPPLLVIQGECDQVVAYTQGLRAREAAASTGSPVEVLLIPNAGHIDPGPADPDGAIVWGRIRAFLARHLHPLAAGASQERTDDAMMSCVRA
jgi:acetyl esterase/lipase